MRNKKYCINDFKVGDVAFDTAFAEIREKKFFDEFGNFIDEDKKYDDYIVFLLGTDSHPVCEEIREIASEFGIDDIYEDCVYVAKKFNIYDKDNYDTMSQYDSFLKFLDEYHKQIITYFRIGTKFYID